MSGKKSKLSERQIKFIRAFKECGNATQAAIKAGYSAKTAKQLGNRLLTNVDIQEELQRVEVQLQTKHEVTLERMIQELAAIAFGSAGDLMEWSEQSMQFVPKKDLKPHQMCFVDTISIGHSESGPTLKMTTLAREKVKSIELMARLLGLDKGSANEKTQLLSVFDEAINEIKRERESKKS